jgi:hypothetical protein
MKASPLKDAFNAGELSPLMAARVRIDKYANAFKLGLNMIPFVQGGSTRRDGTVFVAEVKNSADVTRLIPFEFSVEQAYVLEFGDLYIRVFKDNGVVESSPGVPLEIVTPYEEADIPDLKFVQSADVLYLVHPSYKPRRLSRTSDTSWTLTLITFYDGPYLPLNVTSKTFTPSAVSGNITITASAATFASTDIGRPIRIRHSSTWGYAVITGFNSATSVDATVEEDFGNTTASRNWRLGVWSGTTGYPSCAMFFEDRLFFAGNTAYPQRIDGSRSGDYDNFSPSDTDGTVTASHAVSVTLNSSDINLIRWMMDDEKGLLVGTAGGEWIVRPSTFSEALSPTNIAAKRSTSFGSGKYQAVRAGKSTVYVQRSGRKVRELAYVYEVDGFRAPDMTVLSEHITKGGVTFADYQQEPWGIIWFVRNDGVLIGFTYERDQDVLGWHRHILGGSFGDGDAVVESVAVIPNAAADADELWLIVKRTIDGNTVRYVEYMSGRFDEEDTTNAFFVDCGLTYDGAPTTTITGLDHLEGQVVSVLADGAVHPNRTVESGSITLVREASVVHVGLGYVSDIQTLNIEAGAADGTAQGKTKRINLVVARLYKTLGLKYGPSEDKLDVFTFRTSADAMNSPPALYTGDIKINWNSGYDTEGCMYFRQDQPLPFTLLGLFPQVTTQDR